MTENTQTEGTNTDIAQLMRSRATIYGLLGRIFEREANADFLAQLRDMHYPQNSENPAFNDAFKRLYAFMRHAREDVLSVLAVDFARAFLGSGVLHGDAAFPYESVYTSEHNLLMQDARDQVLATYHANGMDAPTEWRDPEDHLALELEFMRILCERTAEAVEGSGDYDAATLIGTQYSFLVLHLLNWAPRFCIDAQRFCTSDFYRASAALLDAHLCDERALLEDIAEASGIDLNAALEAARAADAAVTAAMVEEAEKEHLVPTVIVTMEEGNVATTQPLDPADAAPLLPPVTFTTDIRGGSGAQGGPDQAAPYAATNDNSPIPGISARPIKE